MKKPARRKQQAKRRSTGAAAPQRPHAPSAPVRRMAPPKIHGRYRWPDLTALPAHARAFAAREVERVARAVPFDADDRPVVAMLLVPFFMLAFAIAANQALRPDAARIVFANRTPAASGFELGKPGTSLAGRRLPAASPVQTTAPNALPVAIARATAPDLAAEVGPPALLAASVAAPPTIAPASSADVLHDIPAPSAIPPGARIPDGVVAVGAADLPVPLAVPPAEAITVALAPPLVPPVRGALPPVAALDEESDPVCRPEPTIASARPVHAPRWQPGDADGWSAFGTLLAGSAESQIGDLVIYNDAYRRISYPMGDVPPLYGVCTDVVIRAYRALGIDLQSEVQRARLGSGDTSIDHRRTETLRRLFARHGQALPVTTFAEDYRPGDIVTYYRPQNTRSRSHIAIVADRIGPSGRPMIVHNRGWGPQLEDALFADRITGHYRYAGLGSQLRAPPEDRVADGAALRAANIGPLLKAAYRPERHSAATSVSRRKR